MSLTLDDLHANPKNPREDWKPEQQAPFLASLRTFGDLGGIVRNIATGQLVGGHKRVEAFRTATTVEIEKTDQPEDGQGTVAHGYVIVDGHRFGYREVRWTPELETAANLAANQWGAEWEWQGVSEALKGIEDLDLLGLTGFPDHELQNLRAADWNPVEREPSMPEDGHRHTVGFTEEQYARLQEVRARFPEAADPEFSDVQLIGLMCDVLLHGPDDGE